VSGAAVVAALAVVVQGQIDRRSDDRIFKTMTADPALELVPSRSTVLERSETRPCQGDSQSGPDVVVAFDSRLSPADLHQFYEAELARLGWENLRVASGELTGSRPEDGYELRVRVYADDFEDVDYWFVVSAEPRQNCLLPVL
jgi:hypothetical protein